MTTNGYPSILLVDDDPGMRETLSEVLRDEGLHVVAAADAQEALALLAGQAVSCVVSDVRMPGMNGIELARHLRRWKPDLPVLLVTGYHDPAALEEVQALGVPVYHKPLRPQTLLQALQQLCRPPLPGEGTASPQPAGVSYRGA